ncbi:Domain of unknown function (DUF2263)-containing protein [uncultured virus]|nr:Domain of unknown function (DUF2263)-containing protein [uncultured virus]
MSQRQFRIKVIKDTIYNINKNSYLNTAGKKIKLPRNLIEDSIKGSKKYDTLDLDKNISKELLNFDCKKFLVNYDCLDVGLLLKSFGYNPCVLNMASCVKAGGGYMTGAGAQEESLFRRTNLHHCLAEQNNLFYPLKNSEIIYTPNALVIKSSELFKYTPLDEYKTMSFMSSAAHKCKKADIYVENSNKYLVKHIEELTSIKIDNMFKIALINGHDSIILSAFGCGAYGNPANHMAKLFKDSISKFDKYFKFIIFAIIDDSNAYSNNMKGNKFFFSEVLGLPSLEIEEFEKNFK